MNKPVLEFKPNDGVFLNGVRIDTLKALKIDSEAKGNAEVTITFDAEVKGLNDQNVLPKF